MTTQRHEIEDWLGDDDWTPEQVDRIVTEYQRWEADADLPDDDSEDESTSEAVAMLTAIAHRVAGVDNLSELSQADAHAQGMAYRARLALRAATVAAVRVGGLSEYEAAAQAGVTRMTVRAWLGK